MSNKLTNETLKELIKEVLEENKKADVLSALAGLKNSPFSSKKSTKKLMVFCLT